MELLARFTSPLASMRDLKRSGETGHGINRKQHQRKSMVSTQRVSNDSDSLSSSPQKSRSANDLLSFRIRSSAPSKPSNGASSDTGLAFRVSTVHRLASTEEDPWETDRSPAKMDITGASSSVQDIRSSATSGLTPTNAEAESVPKLAHRERRFRRLFRNVPTTETLLSRYSCAYVSDLGLLLQGHMYVSDNWICFHSNVFGIEKIIEIPAESVLSVSKAHTAKIIPNAVKIKTEAKYYLFGSLISRDNTYRLLVSVTARSIRFSLANSGNKTSHSKSSPSENPIQTILPKVEFDEESSLSSGLTEDTASSSPFDERKPKTSSVTNVGAGDDAAGQTASRRVAHSDEGRRMGAGGTQERRKRSGLPKTTAARWLLPHIFFGLPKTLMLLITCVVLILFLFLCATVLTIRLIYIRTPGASWKDFMSLRSEEYSGEVISHETLDSMGALLDGTLKVMHQVKQYLETLKVEVKNGLADSSQTASNSGTVVEK